VAGAAAQCRATVEEETEIAMKLRARWIGPPPRTSDYLMSATRPRYAYRVSQVINASSEVRWDPAAKAEVRKLQIVADRVAASEVPKAARVHPWKWDKREARRGALR
jgi:hypothetical protein